jgi:hypothetical protein
MPGTQRKATEGLALLRWLQRSALQWLYHLQVVTTRPTPPGCSPWLVSLLLMFRLGNLSHVEFFAVSLFCLADCLNERGRELAKGASQPVGS